MDEFQNNSEPFCALEGVPLGPDLNQVTPTPAVQANINGEKRQDSLPVVAAVIIIAIIIATVGFVVNMEEKI